MALDTWDPRAAAAGMPIGLPAITTPYPQPPSPPNPAAYTDPVTRPAPTITSLTPNTLAAAGAGLTPIAVVGTNFTNATRFSFTGVLGHSRIVNVTYISPTSMKITLDLTGLAAAAYAVAAVNQDGQTSGSSTVTLT
jgi:hypothetical protein